MSFYLVSWNHVSAFMQMVKQSNFNGDQLIKDEFGMQVREDMALVDARVLPPPLVMICLHFYSGTTSVIEPVFLLMFVLNGTAKIP